LPETEITEALGLKKNLFKSLSSSSILVGVFIVFCSISNYGFINAKMQSSSFAKSQN